jgi:hypothetical protein
MIGRLWKTGGKRTQHITAGPAVLKDDLIHDRLQIVCIGSGEKQ